MWMQKFLAKWLIWHCIKIPVTFKTLYYFVSILDLFQTFIIYLFDFSLPHNQAQGELQQYKFNINYIKI